MTYLTCKFCKKPQKYAIGLIKVNNLGLETYYCSRRCRIHSANKRNLKR